MDMIRWISRFIIFLFVLALYVGIGYIFGLFGWIVAFIFTALGAIYLQYRQLKSMIVVLGEKIEQNRLSEND